LPALDGPVDDETLVYRLIPVGSCRAVDGRWEFQSHAFSNATPVDEDEPRDDMSVVLGDALAALDRVPASLPAESPLGGNPQLWGVAKLQVGFLRHQEQQEILRTPTEDEPAHGDVRGAKNGRRRKALKKHAEWVVQPAKRPE
jgi:hypothetical protein